MAFTPKQLRKLRGETPDSVGNRIRAARRIAKLTQVQLAAELKLTQSAVSDLERRRWASTDVETARKFAEHFGCLIEDLFPARQHSEVA